jgi:phosphoglycerate-specific signal transduction histidine kinase
VTLLEQLPARVEALASQISHLRTEMRAEFSAVRGEMTEQGTTLARTLRQEMAAQGKALRQELAEQGKALRAEMADLGTSLRTEVAEQADVLRSEFKSDLRSEIGGLATEMRVLHEEVIGRIALLADKAGPHRRVGGLVRSRGSADHRQVGPPPR